MLVTEENASALMCARLISLLNTSGPANRQSASKAVKFLFFLSKSQISVFSHVALIAHDVFTDITFTA